MSRRLDAAGVTVSLDRHPDMPHGFMEAAAFIPAARRAIRSAADWIRALDPEEAR
jgi:acetyl esterase/lipase